MKNRSWTIGPKTELGNWSLGLIIVMFLLLTAGISFTNSLYEGIAPGGTILADISARPALALSMLAGMLAGLIALITGLLAILRDKERAIMVYISSLLGAGLTFLLIAEILFPH